MQYVIQKTKKGVVCSHYPIDHICWYTTNINAIYKNREHDYDQYNTVKCGCENKVIEAKE